MKFNSVFLISRIRESANNFIINELKKAGIKGIAPSHGDIMAALYKEDKIPMNLLAKKIRRTKATLTVLADKLVALGLIEKEKSESDNRITYVKLTPEGLKFRETFENISKELNNLAYKGFSETEAEIAEKLLEKMEQNFR